MTFSSQGNILRYPVSFLVIVIQKVTQILTGISLPPGCDIGPGIYIAHFGGIVIHPEVTIGSNVNLGVGVVIGYGRSKGQFGCPRLGNRVFVGPGAKILGPVYIGNDVAIGANAVVTKDVPDRAVVCGVPAKLVSYGGSFDYVLYDNMVNDPDRLLSIEQGVSQTKKR